MGPRAGGEKSRTLKREDRDEKGERERGNRGTGYRVRGMGYGVWGGGGRDEGGKRVVVFCRGVTVHSEGEVRDTHGPAGRSGGANVKTRRKLSVQACQ